MLVVIVKPLLITLYSTTIFPSLSVSESLLITFEISPFFNVILPSCPKISNIFALLISVFTYFVLTAISPLVVTNVSGPSVISIFSGIFEFVILNPVTELYSVSLLEFNWPLNNSADVMFDEVVINPFGSWFSIPFIYFAVYFVPELCIVISEFVVISTLLASTSDAYINVTTNSSYEFLVHFIVLSVFFNVIVTLPSLFSQSLSVNSAPPFVAIVPKDNTSIDSGNFSLNFGATTFIVVCFIGYWLSVSLDFIANWTTLLSFPSIENILFVIISVFNSAEALESACKFKLTAFTESILNPL